MPRAHRWFAAWYDTLLRPTERRLGPVRRELLADLGGDVLDVGAGTGANFAYYGDGARVVAIEPDPHMLRRAQAKLVALGRTNVDVRQAAAEALPFDDASFDFVVFTLVLCTVDDPARAITEARRVLRPGGELIIIEHVRGEGALGLVHEVIQPVYGWFAAGCHNTRRTERTLAGAGFDVGKLDHVTLNFFAPVISGRAGLR